MQPDAETWRPILSFWDLVEICSFLEHFLSQEKENSLSTIITAIFMGVNTFYCILSIIHPDRCVTFPASYGSHPSRMCPKKNLQRAVSTSSSLSWLIAWPTYKGSSFQPLGSEISFLWSWSISRDQVRDKNVDEPLNWELCFSLFRLL